VIFVRCRIVLCWYGLSWKPEIRVVLVAARLMPIFGDLAVNWFSVGGANGESFWLSVCESI